MALRGVRTDVRIPDSSQGGWGSLREDSRSGLTIFQGCCCYGMDCTPQINVPKFQQASEEARPANACVSDFWPEKQTCRVRPAARADGQALSPGARHVRCHRRPLFKGRRAFPRRASAPGAKLLSESSVPPTPRSGSGASGRTPAGAGLGESRPPRGRTRGNCELESAARCVAFAALRWLESK